MTELRSQLKRSFFTFINTILHNEAFPVISGKGQDVVWMVLMSVADGALHFPDPVVFTIYSMPQILHIKILRKPKI